MNFVMEKSITLKRSEWKDAIGANTCVIHFDFGSLLSIAYRASLIEHRFFGD